MAAEREKQWSVQFSVVCVQARDTHCIRGKKNDSLLCCHKYLGILPYQRLKFFCVDSRFFATSEALIWVKFNVLFSMLCGIRCMRCMFVINATSIRTNLGSTNEFQTSALLNTLSFKPKHPIKKMVINCMESLILINWFWKGNKHCLWWIWE